MGLGISTDLVGCPLKSICRVPWRLLGKHLSYVRREPVVKG